MAKHSKVTGVIVNLDGSLWDRTLEVSVVRKLDRSLAYTSPSYDEVVVYELRKYGPSHIRLMRAAWRHLNHQGEGTFEREVKL